MRETSPGSNPLDADPRAPSTPPRAKRRARIVEGLRVLSLRHLEEGTASIERALRPHDLWPIPQPGNSRLTDPWLVSVNKSETLLITAQNDLANSVLVDLTAGKADLAYVADQSAGYVTFELSGSGLSEVQQSLMDSSSIPQRDGQTCCTRLMDIRVIIIRLDTTRILLVLDRMYRNYAEQWIAKATENE